MTLPPAFEYRMRQALGPSFEAFVAALEAPAPVSIRLNPFKQINRPENTGGVKWHKDGVYLDQRPLFTLDPLFHAGAYYVQEASSMFVGEALRQLCPPARPLRALDLAAAPGGKSTLLASDLPSGSMLLANEVIRSRYPVLEENLIRWGYAGAHSSSHDPRDFEPLAGFFDLLLVDAPCSGEGLFRKDPNAAGEWSPEAVTHCSARQRRILADSLSLLAPGGILLYTTCTFNEEENDHNAAWILEQGPFASLKLSVPPDWGIVETRLGYAFYPHLVKGEGFYLAAFRRTDGPAYEEDHPGQFRGLSPLPRRQRELLSPWLADPASFSFFQKPGGGILALPEAHLEAGLILARYLSRLRLGLPVGEFKGQEFIPDHALALSTAVNPAMPAAELSLEQALQYLKKEDPGKIDAAPGWTLARYQGLNLGWMKVLSNRINNYLPKEWRIRMELRRG